jgi:predicted membrane chloride channel (bestrophin family)
LIEDIEIAGLPMFLLAAYFLLGIELVAEEIEEPFGEGGDNLPLERYCATIESSVREILGTPDSNVSISAPAGRKDPPSSLRLP